jgi:putative copper resistance protein D
MTYYITETLLYLCFSILMGSLILKAIPETKKPSLQIPNWLIVICALGIPLLSFIPVYKVTKFYQAAFETDFFTIFTDVLFDTNFGKGWIYTLILAVALLLIVSVKQFQNDKATPYVGITILFALVIAFGWSSHTSSLYGWKGIVVHTIHFLAVIVWLGILFVVAWFAKDRQNWSSFLRWFSPLSIVCVCVTIAAGIGIMLFVASDYLNSWMVPYGHALLIKHILIIPLLLFAFINGFLMRRKLNSNPDFNFSPWLKGESIMALFVFGATAVMGQQEPPHDVALYLKNAEPSKLFATFYQGTFTPETRVLFGMNTSTLIFGILALACLALTFMTFKRKMHVAIAIGLSLGFASFAYFTIMKSII